MMQPKLTLKIIMLAFVICFSSASPGLSEISVYDAENQHLGIYMGSDSDGYWIEVFVPTLGASIFINEDNIQLSSDIFFESEDCSGTAYEYTVAPYYPVFSVYLKAEGCQDKYYAKVNKKKSFVPKSILSDCQCEKYTGGAAFMPYNELVEIPKSSFPFSMPFALPLKLKYSSGGDINGDGKTGLEEAVNALQITSGLKNPGPPVGGDK